MPVVHICGQIENSTTTEKQEDFHLKYELNLEIHCLKYSAKQTQLILVLFH